MIACCIIAVCTVKLRAAVVCVKLFSSGLSQLGEEDECSGLWGFIEADILKEVRRARKLVCIVADISFCY